MPPAEHAPLPHNAHLLARAKQQRRQRQQQQLRPLPLFRQMPVRPPRHAGAGIAPQAHGLRRLPLHVAHKNPIGPGAAAPIDPAGGIALHERAVLPERVAYTYAAAAVHALGYGGGYALGGHQQRR